MDRALRFVDESDYEGSRREEFEQSCYGKQRSVAGCRHDGIVP